MKSTLRLAVALALPAALSGCHVLPVGADDIPKLQALMQQANAIPTPNQSAQKPLAAASCAAGPHALAVALAGSAAPTAPAAPMAIPARLYPMNEIATENGMVA